MSIDYTALTLFLVAFVVINAGAITRIKSDLSRLRRSLRDCEKMVRYVLVPCLVLNVISRADGVVVKAAVTDPGILVGFLIVVAAEPLVGWLLSRCYGDTKSGSLLSALCLSTSSQALPLTVMVSLPMLHGEDEGDKLYGMDFPAVRTFAVLMCVCRLSVERIAVRLSSTPTSVEKKTTDDEASSSTSPQQLLHRVLGDNSPAIGALAVALLLNATDLATSDSENAAEIKAGRAPAGGIVPFLLGVTSTLADGVIPYAACVEGLEFVCAVVPTGEAGDADDEDDDDQHAVSMLAEFLVHSAHSALRLLVAAAASFLIIGAQKRSTTTAEESSRRTAALLVIVMTAFSAGVAYPANSEALRMSDRRAKLSSHQMRRVLLCNACLAFVAIPVVMDFVA